MNRLARGLAAGAAGTAAMTLSQTIEMRLTGRAASDVPGRVLQTALGFEVNDPARASALSWAVHTAHGLGAGLQRALVVERTGARGPVAAVALFALLWPSDAATYRALGVDDWPWQWPVAGLLTDLFHKGVLVGVTSWAYEALGDEEELEPA